MPQEKVLKFPYTKVPVSDVYGKKIGEAYRPIVSLSLFYGGKKIQRISLCYIWAGEGLFSREIFRRLGHKLNKRKTRRFAGNWGAI